MKKKGIVLLSGGLDSLTVLAHAQSQGHQMHAVSFDYGQRHRFELTAAQRIAKHYQIPHQIVQIADLYSLGSANKDE